MRVLKRVSILLGLWLAAPVAFAANGVVEINAACVDSGCFDGDTAGFPVTISQPGSYVLTSNLTVASENDNAIVISADDITLDLNGFVVSGPTSCSGSPVTSCSPLGSGKGISVDSYSNDRTRIHNGGVTGFGDTGIDLGRDGQLMDLRVSGNGDNGIDGGSGTLITRVHVVGNGGYGINTYGMDSMTELSHSLIKGNGSYGARVYDGIVFQNRFSNNGDNGLRSFTSTSAAGYMDNIFRDNDSGGTQVQGGVALGCNVINDARVCP